MSVWLTFMDKEIVSGTARQLGCTERVRQGEECSNDGISAVLRLWSFGGVVRRRVGAVCGCVPPIISQTELFVAAPDHRARHAFAAPTQTTEPNLSRQRHLKNGQQRPMA
jgi:hypothetical protein